MEVIKHIGKHKSTGERVIVLMRQLPGTTDALVVMYEALKNPYDAELLTLAKSEKGQKADPLADYLNTRTFSTNIPVVESLHKHGHIKKVGTDMITMDLGKGHFMQLDQLNSMIDGTEIEPTDLPTAPAETASVVEDGPVNSVAPDPVDKYEEAINIVSKISSVLTAETETDKMIDVARKIEKSAKEIREAVYAIDPTYKKGGKR